MSKISIDFYLMVRAEKTRSSRRFDLKLPRVVSSRNGVPPSKPGEIPINLSVSLPESLFKEPQFTAAISVAEESVTPGTVSAEVVNNIQEIVRETTGLELTIHQDQLEELDNAT